MPETSSELHNQPRRGRLPDCAYRLNDHSDQSDLIALGTVLQNSFAEQVKRLPSNHTKRELSEDILRRVAFDSAEIILEVTHALGISETQVIPEIRKFDNPAKAAEFSIRDGKYYIALSTQTVLEVARMMQYKKGPIARTILREHISHELYHMYTAINFPAVIQQTHLANQEHAAYQVDRGEIAANLFSVEHLKNQPVADENQRMLNNNRAKEILRDLGARLQSAGDSKLRQFGARLLRMAGF